MRSARCLLFASVLLAAVGCSPSAPPLPTVTVAIAGSTSTLTVRAEVASSEAAREHGLMGRKSLRADAGMLFTFPEPTAAGFYMKNTLIPLDIAFISAGKVVEVASMVPCRVARCPVTYPSVAYEQALEVAAGAFGRVGITAGATVEIQGSLPAPN